MQGFFITTSRFNSVSIDFYLLDEKIIVMEIDTKIQKINDTLVITVPLKSRRSNPWDESYHPEMDAIIGLVESENDMGLCYRNDMDYKGKDDQWTDYFFKWQGDRSEFEKICSQLSIDMVEAHDD